MAYKFVALSAESSLGGRCLSCVDVCPVGAIAFKPVDTGGKNALAGNQDALEGHVVQINECIGCGACENQCPQSGIRIVETGGEPEYETGIFLLPVYASASEEPVGMGRPREFRGSYVISAGRK